uniref:Uncharacterized protein n=1 Tax=Chelonoidis abingdonii TaxID=106734 RepID=A0A8C0IT77_CHEAB
MICLIGPSSGNNISVQAVLTGGVPPAQGGGIHQNCTTANEIWRLVSEAGSPSADISISFCNFPSLSTFAFCTFPSLPAFSRCIFTLSSMSSYNFNYFPFEACKRVFVFRLARDLLSQLLRAACFLVVSGISSYQLSVAMQLHHRQPSALSVYIIPLSYTVIR